MAHALKQALTPGEIVELGIESLGALGDGVAKVDGASVFVPLTAPGDRVRARIEAKRGDGFAATILDWVERTPDRREPPCAHFGTCGGCAWQHLSDASYSAVKRDLLIAALERQGLTPEVAAARISPPGDRRRVRFSGRRDKSDVTLGLRQRAGHAIVDLTVCPVVHPAIEALLEPMRRVAATLGVLKSAEFQVAVTRSDTGLDATWSLPREPALPDRQRLVGFADASDLARVAWKLPGGDDEQTGSAETIAQRRPVQMSFAGTMVDLPPDAFLQASIAGEAAIRALVVDAVAGARNGPVADLYAGIGTLSLPLAATRQVLAVEGDEAAAGALGHAARRGAINRLTVERRDLARRPLVVEELKKFRAVVFDPPRAGALPQARLLAASKVPLVVAVSCDPATLARDLRVLSDGGYTIERITPVDQFLWSPRIEAVAVLRR